jgi:hypothetical protein
VAGRPYGAVTDRDLEFRHEPPSICRVGQAARGGARSSGCWLGERLYGVWARSACGSYRPRLPGLHRISRPCRGRPVPGAMRRRTGIEPADDAKRRPPVLKTGGATRHPDASAAEATRARAAPAIRSTEYAQQGDRGRVRAGR